MGEGKPIIKRPAPPCSTVASARSASALVSCIYRPRIALETAPAIVASALGQTNYAVSSPHNLIEHNRMSIDPRVGIIFYSWFHHSLGISFHAPHIHVISSSPYPLRLIFRGVIVAVGANLFPVLEKDPRDGKQRNRNEPQQARCPRDPQLVVHYHRESALKFTRPRTMDLSTHSEW